jgi:DNA-binding NarL/FixJ family response regulator
VAQAQTLHPVVGSPLPPLVQVHLQRHEPHGVALERALRGLPVTPGQAAVCRALYQGQAQARIAEQLGVASTTVIDHVRKAYRTLNLHTVQELRALLDQRMAEQSSRSSLALA